jgi:hypothetical protein
VILAAESCGLAQSACSPVIYTQPQGNTTVPGVPNGFSVVASGYPPLTYQWRFDGVAIAKANSSEYDVTDVTLSNAGPYDVVVANAFGAVTSSVAVLRVNEQGPGIAAGPGDQWACVGQTAEFVNIIWSQGGGPRQWQHNGTNLPGATGHVLTLTDVQPADAGEYRVIITNACCSATSAVVTLTVDPPKPLLLAQPLSKIVRAGYETSLAVEAFFCSPLGFQWRHNGSPVAGATNSVLTFIPIVASDEGGYDLVVDSASGSVTSRIAWLVVTQYPPSVVSQPVSQAVYAGSPVQFDVATDGAPPPTYQWFLNGATLPGATNASFVINSVASTDQAGGYSVVLSNALGKATSEVVTLTVLETAPCFDKEPFSQGAVLGESATFSFSGAGQPPPSYQWFFTDRVVLGETNTTLTIASVTASAVGGYFVVASNEAGVVTSKVATLTLVSIGALDRCEWRHPVPQGNDLYATACGNGSLVVVGRKGAKAVSADGGTTWRYALHDRSSAYGVAFGAGLFVAIGGNQGRANEGLPVTLQTSTDGLHWTDRVISPTNLPTLTDVAYGAGQFVAVGGGPAVLVSGDGLHWREHDLGLGYSASKIHYTGERFLVAGGGVGASVDGWNWTNVVGPWPIDDVAEGNGLLPLSRGYSWVLDCDGCPRTRYSLVEAWALTGPYPGGLGVQTVSDGAAPAAALAFGNGRFVLAGATANPVLYSSEDLVAWYDHSEQSTDKLLGVSFVGDRFVAVGNHGLIVTSSDGRSWSAANSTSARNFRGVVQGNGLYVAVGNEGLLMTSGDGVAWMYQAIPTSNNLRGVTYKDGRFVAVGETDAMGATILVSSNGVSWRRWYPNTLNGLYDITTSSNLFVAVGDNGEVVTSHDGEYWFSQPATNQVWPGVVPRLNSVTWGGGKYIAVGQYGSVLTSSDATNWMLLVPTAPWMPYLQGVTYGNGTFVAMGKSGALAVSSNGVDWVAQATAFANRDIEDVCFAENLFVAVGENGFVATSPDGIVWTPRLSRCQNALRGVTYSHHHFLAVGNNETILQSGFLGAPILRARGPVTSEGFEFNIEGEYGRGYWLQGSDDLENWEDLMFFTNQQETTLFQDTTAGWWPRRFYRAFSQ